MRPVLFKILGYPIHAYGFFLGVAYLVGFFWGSTRLHGRGVNERLCIRLFLWIVVTSLVGAKLVAMFEAAIGLGLMSCRDVLFAQTGFSYLGGLVGASLVTVVWCFRHSISATTTGDALFPVVAFGYATARVGCFFAGCCGGVGARPEG